MVPSLKFDNEDIIYLSLNGDTIHDKPEFNLWNDLRTLYKPDIYSEEVFSVEELNIIEKHIDKIKSNPDFKNQQEDKQHNNDEQDDEDKKAIKNFIEGNINDKALIGLGTLSTFDIYDNTCINYDCKDFDNIVNEKEIKKQKRIKEEIELKISLDNISNYKDIYKNLLEGLKNTTDFLQNKFFDDEISLLHTEIEKPNEESTQQTIKESTQHTIEEKKGTKRKRTIEEPNEESKLKQQTIEEKKGTIEEPKLEEGTIEDPKLEEETKGTKRKRTIEESILKQEPKLEEETIEEPNLEEETKRKTLDPLEEKEQGTIGKKGTKRKKQESDEEKQAKKAATAAKSAATKAANKAKAAEKKELAEKEAQKRNNK
jgi:hypothetical protein